MRKYICLIIVCIATLWAPPTIQAQTVVYDTAITYEITNGKLYREFCVTRSDFPLPLDANVHMVDSVLPKELSNKEIIELAKNQNTVIHKKNKITLKGEHGNGFGIQLYEFFYEPYQMRIAEYGCKNNDVQELQVTTTKKQYMIRWDQICMIVILLIFIVLIVYFWKKIRTFVGKIRF